MRKKRASHAYGSLGETTRVPHLDCRAPHASKLWGDENGATLLEYSLLVGLISAMEIIVVGSIIPWLTGRWTILQTALGIGSGS